jgi:hypothetical protein
MPGFDPRSWNLVPSALLLAAACGPPGIPYEDGADDVADDPDGSDTPDDSPAECTLDADCPPGYYCSEEVCKPEVYSDDDYTDWDDDYTDYSDYSDYSDDYTDYSDYADDWDDDYTDYSDYSDGWYECFSDYDCAPGYECVDYSCVPKPPLEEPVECEAPPIIEIPLPNVGTVLDLQLADVDGDGDDELVLLQADGIAVIHDDDSVVQTPWVAPPAVPLRQIAVLALDEDGANDLVAFPDILGPATIMVGDGTGDFTSLGAMANAPLASQLLGFDAELDGVDRLLALRPDIQRIAQFSDPTTLSGNHVLIGPSQASDLDLLQLDSVLAPNVLIGVGCAGSVRTGPALVELQALQNPDFGVGICEWQAAAFVDGEPDQPLVVFSQGDIGLLQRWDLVNQLAFQLQVPIGPTSSTTANLDGTGDFLLLTDPGDGRVLWGWTNEDPGCIAPLPFVGSLRFAVGDRDGDGTQDVATLDADGVVKLWRVP